MKIIYMLLILGTLSSCKFSESSDGKRIIAAGKKFVWELAEDELNYLIQEELK